MDLTKELYDRIQETAQVQTLKIGSKDYTTQKVYMVEDPIDKPSTYKVNTLSGLVSLVKTEIKSIKELPLIVNVCNHREVNVWTTYDNRFERSWLYSATADLPSLERGFVDHETFMVELRSKFIRNDDVNYLLQLLASVVDENSVKSTDNGLSQQVQVKQGITTIGNAEVKPIVSLAPYRTFLEVQQPESEFLVRLKEGGYIALFEADGGAWKLNAKKNIAGYLREALKGYIVDRKVVVAE